MKSLVLLSFIFGSYLLDAQSVAHSLLPQTKDRFAFKKIENNTQRELAIEYAKSYFSTAVLRAPYLNYYQTLFQKYLYQSPNLFRELGLKQLPTYENTVDFLNEFDDFKSIIKSTEFGTCMGVTSVMRKINMLAHFDPDNSSQTYVPINNSLRVKYYKHLIDKIMANQPVIIPYYNNTREWTSAPEFKEYFLRHALDQWGLNNVTLQAGVFQMLRGVSNTMSPRHKQQLYKKLKRRLELGYNPKIFFALKGDITQIQNLRIHVVQVFKIDKPDKNGNYMIHYWDPNFKYYDIETEEINELPLWLRMRIETADEELELSDNKEMAYFMNIAKTLKVSSNGHTSTANYNNISYLDIYRWDDAEVAEIMSNYSKFCLNSPQFCHNQ